MHRVAHTGIGLYCVRSCILTIWLEVCHRVRHHRCVATYTAKIRKLHRPPVVIAVQIPRVSTKYHAKNSLFFVMCTCHHILHVRGLLFLFTNRPIIFWFVSINKKVVTHAFDYVGVQQNWQKIRDRLLYNFTTVHHSIFTWKLGLLGKMVCIPFSCHLTCYKVVLKCVNDTSKCLFAQIYVIWHDNTFQKIYKFPHN